MLSIYSIFVFVNSVLEWEYLLEPDFSRSTDTTYTGIKTSQVLVVEGRTTGLTKRIQDQTMTYSKAVSNGVIKVVRDNSS